MSKILDFMKRYRLVVNPNAVESDIYTGHFRKLAPASQPKYVPPVTDNAKISNNYYFQRDTRRNYPQTQTVLNPAIAPSLPDQVLFKLPQPAGPTVPAVGDTLASNVNSTELNQVVPPSITNKHQNWTRSPDSVLPSFSPNVYFHVTGYK